MKLTGDVFLLRRLCFRSLTSLSRFGRQLSRPGKNHYGGRLDYILFKRFFAEKIVKTPFMADSITQGTLSSWEKKVGEFVKEDETVANIETDKVTIPVNSPEAGVLTKQFAKTGETIEVGSDLFTIDPDQKPTISSNQSSEATKTKASDAKASVGPTKAKPSPLFVEAKPSSTANILSPKPNASNDNGTKVATPVIAATKPNTSFSATSSSTTSRGERREPMTRMRQRIAERMKEAQNGAASLTTFNEIDLSALLAARSRLQEDFRSKHGIKLGLMGPFVRAAATVLQEIPVVNARIDSSDIVYHDYVDISVAVATPKGLVTPVIRNCHLLSMAEVEKHIAELGERARNQQISLEELAGGTFTISNGGVFGSMMGTPIINVPQSAILGMHAIKERPVVVEGGKIEARPMMYVALTYDHRLIDGREAVTFLVRMKQLLEDPLRFLFTL